MSLFSEHVLFDKMADFKRSTSTASLVGPNDVDCGDGPCRSAFSHNKAQHRKKSYARLAKLRCVSDDCDSKWVPFPELLASFDSRSKLFGSGAKALGSIPRMAVLPVEFSTPATDYSSALSAQHFTTAFTVVTQSTTKAGTEPVPESTTKKWRWAGSGLESLFFVASV
jgi:hypothetical protein